MSLLHTLRQRVAPDRTARATAVSILKDFVKAPSSLGQRLHLTNFRNYRALRDLIITCNVCGQSGRTFYDFPNLQRRLDHGIGLVRETVSCNNCGATMRHRALAAGLLSAIARLDGREFATIRAYRDSSVSLRILDTDSYSPINRILLGMPGYACSSFLPAFRFGSKIGPNRFNIDLQKIDFPTAAFDILLTSDVMEHVENDQQAHAEIHRVLDDGGCYVFTVPYDGNAENERVLVTSTSSGPVFHEPPHYHGDSITSGVLAYRVYGRSLSSALSGIGFDVEFMDIHDAARGILHGDCFIAVKRPTDGGATCLTLP